MLEQMLSGEEDCLRGRWVYQKKSILSSLSCFLLSSGRMHCAESSLSQGLGQQFHRQPDVMPKCSLEARGRKKRRSIQRRRNFRGDFLSPESRTHLLHWYHHSHSCCVWGACVISCALYMQVFRLSELFFAGFYRWDLDDSALDSFHLDLAQGSWWPPQRGVSKKAALPLSEYWAERVLKERETESALPD